MKINLSKLIIRICLVFSLIVILVGGATLFTEGGAPTVPSYGKEDLSALLRKESLTEEDYILLREQTGLGEEIVDILWQEENRKEIFLAEQQKFFDAPEYYCHNLAIVSMAETIINSEEAYQLYDLRPGDVLLTKSTHTLFWRHGHCALYLGDGKILEATAIGSMTSVIDAENWGSYTTGMHLRLKENSDTLGEEAAAYAKKELIDDKYRLLAGAFDIGVETDATQCAYLIWAAYDQCGIDISARDFPVTPASILNSGKFEILRVWGYDPKDLNW
ncbi:MAG: hypothetical protein IJO94_03680 [Firmicutes bacterium]|nr:hypothetical protein [Bacillota bacterium]